MVLPFWYVAMLLRLFERPSTPDKLGERIFAIAVVQWCGGRGLIMRPTEVVPSSLPLAAALFQRAQAEQEDNQAALPIAGSSEVHGPITKAGRPKKVKKAAPSSGGSGTPKVKKVKATVPADIISPGGTKQRAKRTKKESLAGRRLEEALADEQEDEREMDEEEREEGGWVPEAEGMDIDD